MRSLVVLTVVLAITSHASAKPPEPPLTPSDARVELVAHVITQLNPQTQQQGWRWRYEQSRYYTKEQIRAYAGQILKTAAAYNQDWKYLVAIIQEQSRFHFDAVSPTRDYGIAQIHCGRHSPFCRYPVTKQVKQKLFDPQWSIDALGQWLAMKQARCADAKPHSRTHRRCTRNKSLTGVPGLLGRPKKTEHILKHIGRILEKVIAPQDGEV